MPGSCITRSSTMKNSKRTTQGTDEPNAKERIVQTMRQNATAGSYKKFPEFEALCLSPAGYDPEVARSALAHHAGDPVARFLLMACDAHSAIWHSKLKAVEPAGSGDGGDGQVVYVTMPPEYSGGPQLVNYARYIGRVIAEGVQGSFRLADRLAAALDG